MREFDKAFEQITTKVQTLFPSCGGEFVLTL